jgi:hypothetical protein
VLTGRPAGAGIGKNATFFEERRARADRKTFRPILNRKRGERRDLAMSA